MSKAQFLKENQKTGEVYAGLILGQDGEKDYHLFILPGEAERVTFAQAQDWAKKAGGDLPNRREQRVLFANAKAAFQPALYWSGEKHASVSDYAWVQDFDSGGQGSGNAYTQLRARAVRRLFI